MMQLTNRRLLLGVVGLSAIAALACLGTLLTESGEGRTVRDLRKQIAVLEKRLADLEQHVLNQHDGWEIPLASPPPVPQSE